MCAILLLRSDFGPFVRPAPVAVTIPEMVGKTKKNAFYPCNQPRIGAEVLHEGLSVPGLLPRLGGLRSGLCVAAAGRTRRTGIRQIFASKALSLASS